MCAVSSSLMFQFFNIENCNLKDSISHRFSYDCEMREDGRGNK